MSCYTCTSENPCTAVQLLEQRIENHELESGKRLDKMDEVIDSLRNRLPLWATMAFTGAGLIIGLLVNHAFTSAGVLIGMLR